MRTELAAAPRLRRVAAVEVPCGAGARDDGCREGPAEFRRSTDGALRSRGVELAWQRMPQDLCTPQLPPLNAVSQTSRWTAGVTHRLTARGEKFVAIGGDHSCAIGTWSGVADALRPSGPLGLIWIDAHMDMHVPTTTPSGAIHGMPLAALLGHGAAELTSVATTGPALHPRHVCLVGIRSYEDEEIALAERLNIRVVGMDEVNRRGIDDVLAEARAIAANGTAGYGVSLDLDAFDPHDAPGVGTPVPDGIRTATFLRAWSELTQDRRCLGFEIVEYNPRHDASGCTARLMSSLVCAGLKERVS